MKMKSKFFVVTLLAIFSIVGTSCKSGKTCKGGGWYGDRNLGYESTLENKKLINIKDTNDILDLEDCTLANP